jgi:uncharacterized Ntn-hydrolase superfamily protein
MNMNRLKSTLLGIFLLGTALIIKSQDTFSIVAIDSVTGEIGSAGASCVGYSFYYPHGAAILSDVIPGIGAIHTQASWLAANQNYAHSLMVLGLSPQQIIDSLVANDAQNNPTPRQYGIVDFNNGHPRAASYTGVNCMNYKNDTCNIYYSIQGNILLGQLVLDSMQNRFLGTPGTLADRLMATLQGAKMLGADTRCAAHNSSSLSAFLRVAQPTDPADSLYCDLWMSYSQSFVGNVPVDPIDSLQTLYNQWKTITKVIGKEKVFPVKVWSVSAGEIVFDLSRCPDYSGMTIQIYDFTGRLLAQKTLDGMEKTNHLSLNSYTGICLYQILDSNQTVIGKGKVLVQ